MQPQVNPGYYSWPNSTGYSQCVREAPYPGEFTTTHKKSRKRPLDAEEMESSIEPLRKRPALSQCTPLSNWNEEENNTEVDFTVPPSPNGRFTKEKAWKSVTQREDKQF